MALAVTGAMLAANAEAWRVPFVLAHLAALLALLPLALVLLLATAREEGGPAALVGRHRLVAVLLAVLAVTVTLSLLNFEGDRAVRRAANLSSVAVILVLVARYLRWARLARG